MVSFSLVKKDYLSELYESENLLLMGKRVNFVVSMGYHTYLKYWSVSYYWTYGTNSATKTIKSEDVDDRKNARRIAEFYMSNASIQDIDILDDADFYINDIMNCGV